MAEGGDLPVERDILELSNCSLLMRTEPFLPVTEHFGTLPLALVPKYVNQVTALSTLMAANTRMEVTKNSAYKANEANQEHSEETDITNALTTLVVRDAGMKRSDYIPWDEYFMAVAFLSAMRSKDPCSQVGACIVSNEKKIVGIGYNGMPRGCSDDVLPWNKHSSDPLLTKYMYVCHAEMNAIMNKNSSELGGCTIYVALFPCNECAKLIIQASIREVVFYSDKHAQKESTQASRCLLDMAGVQYRQFVPGRKKIELDFTAGALLDDENNGLPDGHHCLEPTSRDVNKKREDYLAWGEYFMALATLSALRSKDPVTQVGACIVNVENKIVGIGYNGMPRGCSDDHLPWGKTSTNRLENKYMYVCHAEVNAIMNKNCANVSGCTIYVALFPCNECAKVIIQAGITVVVYLCDKYQHLSSTVASKKMLDLAGIKYKPYNLPRRKVVINFEEIDWNNSLREAS